MSEIRYRLSDPSVWTPPTGHRLKDGVYSGAYEPGLELLDEIGIIDVECWGVID